MEFKDIIQADATLIAGLLILLGLSSVTHNLGSVIFLMASSFFFSISILFSITGVLRRHDDEISKHKRNAMLCLGAGVLYLSVAVMISAILQVSQNLFKVNS